MTRAPELSSRLSGTNVLVVEDEFYLAMDIKEEIEAAGGKVLGPSPDVAGTLSMIEREVPDCAIVDINLGEGVSFEIAEELNRRSIPFLFPTGYDAASIPPRLAHAERLAKPADAKRVVDAVTRLTGH